MKRTTLQTGTVLLGCLIMVAQAGSEASAAYTYHYWQGATTGGDTSSDPSNPSSQWDQVANWSGGVVPDHYEDKTYIWSTNAGTVYAPTGTWDVDSIDVDGESSDASFVINDSSTELLLATYYVGRDGIGTVTQTDGYVRAYWGMSVATHTGAVGTYHLEGGSVVVSNHHLDVAYQGEAHVIQTGGTCQASITLSADQGGVGYYTLSGAGQIINSRIVVGEEGSGFYTQTGGSASFSSFLLGSSHNLAWPREGTAEISGGSLTTLGMVIGTGPSQTGPFDANLKILGADATIQVGANGLYMTHKGELQSEVDGTGISTIQVAGEATLDGTWTVIDGGAGLGQFDILTATGGISGAFDTIVLPDPLTWIYGTTGNTLWVQHIAEAATVVLDIKPGSDPNSVNLKSKGLLPVVAYGSEGLDLTEIDLDTLLLNGVGPRLKPNGSWHVSFEDVDGDLLLDLVMHFEMQALGIEPGMTELALTGVLMDGTEFEGADVIRIVPDFNGDLMVNATDLAIMKHSYGSAGVGFELGDANADGLVDATDLALLRLDLGWSESAFGEPIPEPATLLVMTAAGLAILRRRRRSAEGGKRKRKSRA